MFRRGVRFGKPSLYKSHARKYLPSSGVLLPPFVSIRDRRAGGTSHRQEARDELLSHRSKTLEGAPNSASCVKCSKNTGILENLPEGESGSRCSRQRTHNRDSGRDCSLPLLSRFHSASGRFLSLPAHMQIRPLDDRIRRDLDNRRDNPRGIMTPWRAKSIEKIEVRPHETPVTPMPTAKISSNHSESRPAIQFSETRAERDLERAPVRPAVNVKWGM